MARGRAYLDDTDSPLYIVEFQRFDNDKPGYRWVMGPYGTKGAAKGQRTSEVNQRERPSDGSTRVVGRIYECKSPDWEEVLD